jgi:hypothetical protein
MIPRSTINLYSKNKNNSMKYIINLKIYDEVTVSSGNTGVTGSTGATGAAAAMPKFFSTSNLKSNFSAPADVEIPETLTKLKTSYYTFVYSGTGTTGMSVGEIKDSTKAAKGLTGITKEIFYIGATATDDSVVINDSRNSLTHEIYVGTSHYTQSQISKLVESYKVSQAKISFKNAMQSRNGLKNSNLQSATGSTGTTGTNDAPKVTKTKKVKGGTPATGTTGA